MIGHQESQRGTTLIEALIAFIVLGIGLLGMLALQIKAQNTDFDSFQRSQALVMAEDMVNRMAAARSPGCYDTAGEETLPGQWDTGVSTSMAGCSPSSNVDLAAWNEMLRGSGELAGSTDTEVGGLLGALGCIENDLSETNLWYVTVAWQGMSEVPLPEGISSCGKNHYESENLRRVVTLPVYIP
ncbi:type IV pilus modification protein PilV [Rhabdochromatium marinum]|uniref:type IV pilus modification protein PilV n=1 Tax=Rhabdochromatium marinum TaxID=48729 RepID=UPI001906DB1E|nr:type IV pilus modification protein PilV [Rhabdochromatium marinum]MBK1648729.1 type IV pilus modification protein PilV [Rhabdochromatium marinum]